jgi:phosphatidylethanolamine-binding protein (PEBP) family uncharacterized protein
MDDSDSPFGFVRWLVYNIPDQARAISEGASSQKALPAGAAEGLGFAGNSSYARPCPLALNLTVMWSAFMLWRLTRRSPLGMTKQLLASPV